jgi:hypothetical protein
MVYKCEGGENVRFKDKKPVFVLKINICMLV